MNKSSLHLNLIKQSNLNPTILNSLQNNSIWKICTSLNSLGRVSLKLIGSVTLIAVLFYTSYLSRQLVLSASVHAHDFMRLNISFADNIISYSKKSNSNSLLLNPLTEVEYAYSENSLNDYGEVKSNYVLTCAMSVFVFGFFEVVISSLIHWIKWKFAGIPIKIDNEWIDWNSKKVSAVDWFVVSVHTVADSFFCILGRWDILQAYFFSRIFINFITYFAKDELTKKIAIRFLIGLITLFVVMICHKETISINRLPELIRIHDSAVDEIVDDIAEKIVSFDELESGLIFADLSNVVDTVDTVNYNEVLNSKFKYLKTSIEEYLDRAETLKIASNSVTPVLFSRAWFSKHLTLYKINRIIKKYSRDLRALNEVISKYENRKIQINFSFGQVLRDKINCISNNRSLPIFVPTLLSNLVHFYLKLKVNSFELDLSEIENRLLRRSIFMTIRLVKFITMFANSIIYRFIYSCITKIVFDFDFIGIINNYFVDEICYNILVASSLLKKAINSPLGGHTILNFESIWWIMNIAEKLNLINILTNVIRFSDEWSPLAETDFSLVLRSPVKLINLMSVLSFEVIFQLYQKSSIIQVLSLVSNLTNTRAKVNKMPIIGSARQITNEDKNLTSKNNSLSTIVKVQSQIRPIVTVLVDKAVYGTTEALALFNYSESSDYVLFLAILLNGLLQLLIKKSNERFVKRTQSESEVINLIKKVLKLRLIPLFVLFMVFIVTAENSSDIKNIKIDFSLNSLFYLVLIFTIIEAIKDIKKYAIRIFNRSFASLELHKDSVFMRIIGNRVILKKVSTIYEDYTSDSTSIAKFILSLSIIVYSLTYIESRYINDIKQEEV